MGWLAQHHSTGHSSVQFSWVDVFCLGSAQHGTTWGWHRSVQFTMRPDLVWLHLAWPSFTQCSSTWVDMDKQGWHGSAWYSMTELGLAQFTTASLVSVWHSSAWHSTAWLGRAQFSTAAQRGQRFGSVHAGMRGCLLRRRWSFAAPAAAPQGRRVPAEPHPANHAGALSPAACTASSRRACVLRPPACPAAHPGACVAVWLRFTSAFPPAGPGGAVVPTLEKLRQGKEAAGVGGSEQRWLPGEPRASAPPLPTRGPGSYSSPSRHSRAGKLSAASTARGPGCLRAGRVQHCGLRGWAGCARLASSPRVAQSRHRRGPSSFSRQPPSTGTCLERCLRPAKLSCRWPSTCAQSRCCAEARAVPGLFVVLEPTQQRCMAPLTQPQHVHSWPDSPALLHGFAAPFAVTPTHRWLLPCLDFSQPLPGSAAPVPFPK